MRLSWGKCFANCKALCPQEALFWLENKGVRVCARITLLFSASVRGDTCHSPHSPLAKTSVTAPPGYEGLVNVAEHVGLGWALMSLLQMVKLRCQSKGP